VFFLIGMIMWLPNWKYGKIVEFGGWMVLSAILTFCVGIASHYGWHKVNW
jgi:hypothetical protein